MSNSFDKFVDSIIDYSDSQKINNEIILGLIFDIQERLINLEKKYAALSADCDDNTMNDFRIQKPINNKATDIQTEKKIVNIDTNAIQARIKDAIQSASKVSNANNSTVNVQNKVKQIIQEAHIGLYALPCFFDGDRIFGIFCDEHTDNLHLAGSEMEMLANSKYLNKIHISPKCDDIAINDNFDMIYPDNDQMCNIRYNGSDGKVTKRIRVEICEKCSSKIYESKPEKVTLEKFTRDFLAGKIRRD